MTNIEWARLATCSSGIEAEMITNTLESAEIVARVDGGLTGAFGPGYQGVIPGGLTIFVPRADLEEATALLGLDDT